MPAEVAEDTTVYYCLTCGPCLRWSDDEFHYTGHKDVWHPENYVNVDYERTLQ